MHRFFAVCFVLLAFSAASADDKYDLRGPAPEKGQKATHKSKLVLKDADLTLTVGDMKLNLKQTMTMADEEETEIVAVSGRDITKLKTKVVKHSVKVRVGDGEDEDTPEELEGETVVSEKGKDGKWTHTLAEGKPTDAQKRDLTKRDPPENDDEAFPAEKVAVGHKWEFDAAKLPGFTGGSVTDPKGTLKSRFLKVEKVGGEECAVIETTGTVTGKLKPDDEDDPPMAVQMSMTEVSWRSLRTGVEVKGTTDGRMKLKGKQKMGGQEVDMVLDGKMTGEQSAKVK